MRNRLKHPYKEFVQSLRSDFREQAGRSTREARAYARWLERELAVQHGWVKDIPELEIKEVVNEKRNES